MYGNIFFCLVPSVINSVNSVIYFVNYTLIECQNGKFWITKHKFGKLFSSASTCAIDNNLLLFQVTMNKTD